MSETVTIIRKKNHRDEMQYRGHCNRCMKDVRGVRGSVEAASKATVEGWARDHLARHDFRDTWLERMLGYGFEVAGTVELQEA